MLDNFAKTGKYRLLLDYFEAVVRLAGKALEKHVEVTDENGLVLDGEKTNL